MKKLLLALPFALLSLFASAIETEIQGNSTVFFQLSQSAILSNTENIRLLVKDRFNSEIILSERHLVRDRDYTIDYEAGLATFKAPVQATDFELNPQFINANFGVEGTCR